MISNSVKSPITHSRNVIILSTQDEGIDLSKKYLRFLNVDTKRFFKNQSIQLCKCLDTGVKFYFPHQLAGDDEFYEDLARIDWYYQKWKWEYKITEKLLKQDDRVLEIGCGNGAFLERINDQVKYSIGLELNGRAVISAKQKGLNVENVLIQDFAQVNKDDFDVVCSFQVLEHIADVKSFIESSLMVLKVGGRMIVAVPNNEALFFKYQENLTTQYELQQRTLIMNKPPHHMILWDERSLRNLKKIFPLEVRGIFKEPLPKFRYDLFNEIVMKRFLRKAYLPERDTLSKAIRKITPKISQYIYGDTILVEYEKVK